MKKLIRRRKRNFRSISFKRNSREACDILVAKYILRLALETGVAWEELFGDMPSFPSHSSCPSFLELPVVIAGAIDMEEEIELCEKESLEYLVKPQLRDLENALINKLEEFQSFDIDKGDSPLLENIEYLGDKLKLTKIDRELLIFHILKESSYDLTEYAKNASNSSNFNRYDYCKLLSHILDCKASPKEISHALSENAQLMALGFLCWENLSRDIDDKVSVLDELPDILFYKYDIQEDIISCFAEFQKSETLSLEDFQHIQKDAAILVEYLSSALKEGKKGVNILICGQAGTGKTEFARALAKHINARMCSIAYENRDSEALDEKNRLTAFKATQKFFSTNRDMIILFDESENILKSKTSFLSSFMGSGGDFDKGNKGFINKTLEENAIPAIWVMNSTDHIHEAHLRRFMYILPFPLPTKQIRLKIIKRYFDDKNLSENFINRLADSEQITPAQLEQLSEFANTLRHLEKKELEECCLRQLNQSSKILGYKNIQSIEPATVYSFKYLNIDEDVDKLIEGLKNAKKATLCFYGEPGTGKSELAKQIAKTLNKPFINKKASDLLSPYVGMTEKYIAQMFDEAEEKDGILCLDEADSFLRDRQNSTRSWEVTQVNELLTQMESFQGLFICTTNLEEILDKASLRRFDFKIRFKSLSEDMRVDLFMAEINRMGVHSAEMPTQIKLALSKMDSLTPGDFAAVSRKFKVLSKIPSQAELLKALEEELRMKDNNKSRLGF